MVWLVRLGSRVDFGQLALGNEDRERYSPRDLIDARLERRRLEPCADPCPHDVWLPLECFFVPFAMQRQSQHCFGRDSTHLDCVKLLMRRECCQQKRSGMRTFSPSIGDGNQLFCLWASAAEASFAAGLGGVIPSSCSASARKRTRSSSLGWFFSIHSTLLSYHLPASSLSPS